MIKALPNPLQLPWVIYALEQGNASLHRALALANAAASDRQIFIISNSEYATVAQNKLSQNFDATDNISIHSVACSATFGSPDDELLQVSQLFSIAPFVLIVDSLPKGFYGELPDILAELANIPKVLILRDLKPTDALVKPLPRRTARSLDSLIAEHYDLAIIPGDREAPTALTLPPGEQAFCNLKQTHPWLSRLTHSYYQDKATTILVIASAAAEKEIYGYIASTLAQQCPDANIRCFSRIPPNNCPVELWDAYWPPVDYLPGADLVIGSGDYSTVHTCQALGIPLIAFPWQRQDDLQRERLDHAASLSPELIKIVTSPEEALGNAFALLNQMIASRLTELQKTKDVASGLADFVDKTAGKETEGITEAIALIEAAIVAKWNQIAHAAMTADVQQMRERQEALAEDDQW